MSYPVKLEECSWKMIQAALQDGYDMVIIPSGSVEQHGPHLPIITDAAIGEAEAARVAEKLGRAFAAPVIRPGLSAHHMAFPGSLTLTPETYVRELEEVCLSLARHGFKYLVLTSAHGGNFDAIQQSAGKIEAAIREKGYSAAVIPYVDLQDYIEVQQQVLVKEFGGRVEEASGHADVVETAMMLAIHPELVKMEKAEPGWMGDLFEVEEKLHKEGMQALTKNGILGDPRRATAEMGRRVFDVMTDHMAQGIRKLVDERRKNI